MKKRIRMKKYLQNPAEFSIKHPTNQNGYIKLQRRYAWQHRNKKKVIQRLGEINGILYYAKLI